MTEREFERARDNGNADDANLTYCAAHPKIETRLRCGKCGRPICPKCLVFTPVGARCRTCANLKPLPIFQVGPLHYAKALAAMLGVGVIGGFIWMIIASMVPFISFWFVLLAGYASGEAISRAANRKSGRWLQAIAGAGVVLAYVMRGTWPLLLRFPWLAANPLALGDLALREIAGLFTNPIGLLIFALAVYIAARRV